FRSVHGDRLELGVEKVADRPLDPGSVHRLAEATHPLVRLVRADGAGEVTHPQPGVAPLLGVQRRSAEPSREVLVELLTRCRGVLGEHVPEHGRLLLDDVVEGVDEIAHPSVAALLLIGRRRVTPRVGGIVRLDGDLTGHRHTPKSTPWPVSAEIVDEVHGKIVDCVHYLPAMTVVDRFRRFSRTWTEIIGLLGSGLLQTDHSLTEARVLFELAQQERWERSDLRSRLDIDASFLTRVLGRLEDKGLVTSSQSPDDGRALIVELTAAGREAFAELDRRSVEQVTDLVSSLTEEQKASLVESMGVITQLLRPDDSSGEVVIRGIRPGDLGWVVSRHGAICAQEYGWDISFEGLVAKIVADYQTNFRPGRENAWIAEMDGARAGCVFGVERDLATAQLRILIDEPWARGHGIGRRLVDECVSVARSAGYEKMMLWTN